MTDAELAAHLAEVAGRLLIEVRASGMLSLKALGKAGDATANEFLCHALREQRPDDALLSEEEKDNLERLNASRVWIVDPVDGTREYGEARTDWAVHVALAVDGVPTLGAVALPGLGAVLRSDRPVTESNKRKIALMCDVDEDAVVNAVDVPSIYDIPTMLHDQGLDAYIVDALDIDKAADVDWSRWQRVLQAVHNPKHEVTIGLVGKYIDLPDAYLSVTEAIKAGGFAQETHVKITWIPSDLCETPEGAAKALSAVDGIIVPGGFGIRGIEGKTSKCSCRRPERM